MTISLVALAISGLTFWLTRVKKGVVKMTRPTVVFFGPDGAREQSKKVYIRTLLCSTSDQGRYIQNMYIRLRRGESTQNFNVWVYGNERLMRGSGLFISKNGIAYNHHFLMPKDGTSYDFVAGEYLLQVYVEPVGGSSQKIFEQKVFLTNAQKEEMKVKKAGVYFDWAPNTESYSSHIDAGPRRDEELANLIERMVDSKEKE